MSLKRNVVIKILSLRQDADDGLVDILGEILKNGASLNEPNDEDELVRDALEFLSDDESLDGMRENCEEELITEGYIEIDDGGNVEISYEESEMGGLEGSKVRLVFNKETPKLVSMIREGIISTMLSYEEGKRHKSIYRTPYMAFDLTLNTSKVDNRILDGGALVLSYVMEIRGLSVSRCKLELSIS